MFTIHITNQFDREIHLNGERKLINALCDILEKSSAGVNGYVAYTDNQGCEFAQCQIGFRNLKKTSNGTSLAQVFLNFIADNNIKVDKRTEYLFQYWSFEAKQIEENKSYRSNLHTSSQQLLASQKLNTILDRCEENGFLPTREDLFNLFEKSESMEGNYNYCQPLMPYESEICVFETKKLEDRAEIIKSARLVAQGHRDNACLFFKLPSILNQTIAGLTGNPQLHDEKSATKIAIANFGKPHVVMESD